VAAENLPDDLRTVAAQLRERLLDDFSRGMLDGALHVLGDKEVPVRLHLFAPAIREMMHHTLKLLGPDNDVCRCIWFEEKKTDGSPTWEQRASYIVRGGLSDGFVVHDLGLEFDMSVDGLVDAIRSLNGLTHVKPSTLWTEDKAIVSEGKRILDSFVDLFETADAMRDELKRELMGHCPRTVFDALIGETIQEIDIIASRHSIDHPDVHNVEVTSIDADTIVFEASGDIYTTLEWGRGDDAAEMDETFPFKLQLTSPTSKPYEPAAIAQTLEVDNSGWFGPD
jgi:hypothetical protein